MTIIVLIWSFVGLCSKHNSNKHGIHIDRIHIKHAVIAEHFWYDIVSITSKNRCSKYVQLANSYAAYILISVIIPCLSATSDKRAFMLLAQQLQMTTDEYVYLMPNAISVGKFVQLIDYCK